MLLGEFHHNIDEKGRLVIPKDFRDQIGNEFIIAKGIEKCLYVYSLKEWEKLVSELNNLPFTKKNVRTFTRFFFSGSSAGIFDKSGRILINVIHSKYASLDKECIIIGVNDHVEIWNSDLFEEFMDANSEMISEIAETLFEGDTNA